MLVYLILVIFEMYEVEKIVTSRINKKGIWVPNPGKKEYLIKWVGYDSSQNTWEPERNLVNVKDLLEEFEKKNETQDTMNRNRSLKKLAN